MTIATSSVFVIARQPMQAVRLTATGLTLVAAVICLSGRVAKAADLSDRAPAYVTAKMGSGWGAGPIMVSLLGSARREAPIRGVERLQHAVGNIIPAVVPGSRGADDRDLYLAERRSTQEFDGFVAVAATNIINSVER